MAIRVMARGAPKAAARDLVTHSIPQVTTGGESHLFTSTGLGRPNRLCAQLLLSSWIVPHSESGLRRIARRRWTGLVPTSRLAAANVVVVPVAIWRRPLVACAEVEGVAREL